MASLTWWTWVWASSGYWWWMGKPSVLQSLGSQRVGHNWATVLNWPELMIILFLTFRSFYCAYLYNPASKTLPKNHIFLARRTKTANQKQTHMKQTKTKNQNKGIQNQSPGRDQFKASPSQPSHKVWSTAHELAHLTLTTAQRVGLLAAL